MSAISGSELEYRAGFLAGHLLTLQCEVAKLKDFIDHRKVEQLAKEMRRSDPDVADKLLERMKKLKEMVNSM